MTSILIPIGSMFIAVAIGIFMILHRLQKLDEHISRVESAVSHIELSTKHFQASFDYLLQERGMMAKWDWHSDRYIIQSMCCGCSPRSRRECVGCPARKHEFDMMGQLTLHDVVGPLQEQEKLARKMYEALLSGDYSAPKKKKSE